MGKISKVNLVLIYKTFIGFEHEIFWTGWNLQIFKFFLTNGLTNIRKRQHTLFERIKKMNSNYAVYYNDNIFLNIDSFFFDKNFINMKKWSSWKVWKIQPKNTFDPALFSRRKERNSECSSIHCPGSESKSYCNIAERCKKPPRRTSIHEYSISSSLQEARKNTRASLAGNEKDKGEASLK